MHLEVAIPELNLSGTILRIFINVQYAVKAVPGARMYTGVRACTPEKGPGVRSINKLY